MRRLIGALALVGVLILTVGVPGAAAQSYGPGLGPQTWYGPFAGPYGGFLGASGYGATGYGCGQGAYGFASYGYGLAFGLGPGMPTCGGFGNYPYLFPYTVGYPYANGVGPAGALALSTLGNTSPFAVATGCDAVALGSQVPPWAVFSPLGAAAGQFSALNNTNLLNLTNPALASVTTFGTLGTTGFTGCVALR